MVRFQAQRATVSALTLQFTEIQSLVLTRFSLWDFIIIMEKQCSLVFGCVRKESAQERICMAAQIHPSNELFISQQAEIVSPRALSCFLFT